MAHGKKTMPLDRYPYMDNDLKSRESGFVTHGELDTILSDYVTDVRFEDYKNTISSELNGIVDSLTDLNNSVIDLLAFRPLTFDNTGCDSTLTHLENLYILYDYMETVFTKGDTEIKTFFVASDLARFILEDTVTNCLMILVKRYNPSKTKFNYLGFVKSLSNGKTYSSDHPNDTNYLYTFTDQLQRGEERFTTMQRVWANNYDPLSEGV